MFGFVLTTLIVTSTARSQAMQVIELHYRFADDIVPIIQPLLEPGGVLTGTDDKLFVRTSAANFAQIQQAVAAIDRAPRQLLITVGQSTVSSVDAAGIRGSATIGNGDIQVAVHRPPGSPAGAEVQGDARSQETNLQNLSSVQTLEGNETFISVGKSIPITTTDVSPVRRGPGIQQSTSYRDVATGFYATPRVNGDRVVLEVSPRQQRYRRASGGVVETNGATSTVSGRLGEWIELGAVRETSSSSTGGLLVWGRRTGSSGYSAWVKVDEAQTPR